MKRLLLTLAVVALLASVAIAQDIETTMAGRAQIGAGLVSEAWLQNPAVLGMRGTINTSPDGVWQHSAAGLYEIEGEVDLRSISWGGYQAGARWGVGAGYTEVMDMDSFGFGAGWGTPDGRLSVGLNYQSVDVPQGDSLDIFDFAIGGLLPDVCAAFDRGTWGIIARDMADEVETTFDAGVGFESPDWRVALDVEDISDEVETVFQIGATRRFGPMRQYEAGIGLDDDDLTAGFVYRPTADGEVSPWKIGIAWIDADDNADDAWVIGAGADW